MSDNAFQRVRPLAEKDADAGAATNAGSLWRVTAPPFFGSGTARGDLNTDVAIIGAGIAGLSTALHLRERGIEVVVLEAEQSGSAATGASGGIVAPDFVRNGIVRAVKLHGRRRAEHLVRMVGASADFTFALISRHRIECDAQRSGFISPGQSQADIKTMEADNEIWRSLGFAVRFLNERDTSVAIGATIYRGALHFESGGTLNPLAYATGLARVLHRSGARVFTNSAVKRISRDGKKWRVWLDNANVCAKRVVLAANGGNSELHPTLRNSTMPLLVHEYATAPLVDADRRRYLGRGLPYTDRTPYVFTARLDPDGRLISAIPEIVPAWTDSGFVREARRRVVKTFSMELPSIDFRWSGTAHLNSSLLPAVYLPENDLTLVAIQACNGRGLGINTIVGSQVAELLAKGDPESLAIPLVAPKAVPLHLLASKMPRMAMSAARLKDRFGWLGRQQET